MRPNRFGSRAFAIGESIAPGIVRGINPALKAARMAPVESVPSAEQG